jgi:hypothetical protein
MMLRMRKTAAWTAALLAAGIVMLAAFSPGPFTASDRLLAATAPVGPTAVHGVLNEDTPSPTPTLPPTPAPPLARTVRIGPYNDASVVSSGMWGPDVNLGGWSQLAVGPRQGGTFRSYIRFLVAGFPSGLQINGARVLLQPIDGGPRPVQIEADVVQDDWNESTVTWNQQPLSTYRAGVATWQPGSTQPLAIDITTAVQQWYACGGTSNNGIELSSDLSPNWVDFDSRKSESPPVLEVTYQSSVAPANCAAPPTSNQNLTAPQAPGSSTTGAQIGSVNPNDINNPALLNGTPVGSQALPIAPGPSRPANPAPTAFTGGGGGAGGGGFSGGGSSGGGSSGGGSSGGSSTGSSTP